MIIKTLNWLFHASVFIIAAFASVSLWSTLQATLASEPYEIIDLNVEGEIYPGSINKFIYKIVKREDCPGTFTIRLLGASGTYYTLDEGNIGETEPSPDPYDFVKELIFPPSIDPGPATISVVVATTCDRSGGAVARLRIPITIHDIKDRK